MILGHERQLQYLEKVLRNGRLAHAYLFYGPEHVGKFTVAKHFAGLLTPLEINRPKAAAVTPREGGSLTGLNSSEVIILSPEHTLVSKKEKRKDIPLEDIRELKRVFSLAPQGDKWRVALIDQAEKLSQEAADAFLKILEEPGERTLIILVTSEREMLPPTIISRAQLIRFSTVSDETLSGFLDSRTENPAQRKNILALACGRPGIVMKALEGKVYMQDEKKNIEKILAMLREEDVPGAFRFSEKVSPDGEKREKVIEYILRILRRNLISGGLDKNEVSRIKKVMRAAEIMETTNVNPRLALDVILLEAMRKSH